MKLSAIFKKLWPGLVLLLATSAFAANKGSLHVYEPITAGGHQLAPGQYEVKWQGEGPAVELSILSQGKVVATIPARLLELSHAESNDATQLRKNDDGTQSLIEIDFAGKKYALALDNGSAPKSIPGGSSN